MDKKFHFSSFIEWVVRENSRFEYYFSRNLSTWQRAHRDCLARGSNLTSIKSEGEDDWLSENGER